MIIDLLLEKKPKYLKKLGNIKENLFIKIYNLYNR